jgi:peptidoglycan/LPS O-acetylase OafA/YrhL
VGTWRLILAWMVVASHTNGYSELFTLDAGTIAVSTFFFISGFLMPLTYESHYQHYGLLHGSLKFYINRFLKIFPIYWVSILIALGFYLISYTLHKTAPLALFEPVTYIQNFLLIGLNQSALWGQYFRFNNPAWTLDIELQYYLLVPLLLFISLKYKVLLKAVLIAFSALSLYLYFNPTGLVYIDRSILLWSFFFALGFVFYDATVHKSASGSMCFIAVAIGVVLWSGNNAEEMATLLVICVFLVISAFFLVMQKDYKFGRMDRLAGDLSYPTYILHIIFFGPTIKLIGFTNLNSLSIVPQFH